VNAQLVQDTGNEAEQNGWRSKSKRRRVDGREGVFSEETHEVDWAGEVDKGRCLLHEQVTAVY
jgi:hypothetical protein